MTDYIAVEDLRAFIKDPGQLDESSFAAAVSAASLQVDEICGRTFSADSAATARTFWPDGYGCVRTDDIHTTTGLIVKSDTAGDGTYSQTWTITTDFYLEPRNQRVGGITGYPYTAIVATQTSKSFIPGYGLTIPTVQVTAKWGWAAVPKAMEQATKILAFRQVSLGNAPLDTYGGNEFGAMRVGPARSAMELLRPYILDEYAVA